MNKLRTTLLFVLLYSSLSAQKKEEGVSSFHRTVTNWFSAWELVYNNIYGIKDLKPVDFVLFDDQYVYSNSEVSIPEGNSVSGADLLNLSLKWKKKLHEGMLTLPDGSSVPIGMMCFAAENSKNNTPFFVMPLTAFWAKQGIESKTLKLEDLVTGVFLHEFSHTQQMENFGKKINELIKLYQLGDDIDDNLIQDTFGDDSVFICAYNQEMAYFSKSIVDKNQLFKRELASGIQQMEKRRHRFFTDQRSHLAEIEDIFLTMEGLGQYTMYVWLTHEKGANIDRNTAIEGVRRSKKIWSQDQGFVLFLILEKCVSPEKWAPQMFGSKLTFVTDLLKKQLTSNIYVHD